MKALRPDHIWFESFAPVSRSAAGPGLFLDRDGVVVEETNYLHRIEDVRLIDGVVELLQQANRMAMPVVIVTNQAGIGRGYYGWREFAGVNAFIVEQLARHGARVDAVVACPFHEQGVGELCHPDHPMRKPNPGMLLLAGEHLNIDFANSLMIGDQASDLRAAQQAGLRRAVHVLTGHGASRRAEAAALATDHFQVALADSVADPLVMRTLAATPATPAASIAG